MTSRAEGTFQITGWDENTYEELEGGAKLTKAHVTEDFAGDLEGTGTWESLMLPRDGTADYTASSVASGIGDRSGSFVLQTSRDLRRNRRQHQLGRGSRLRDRRPARADRRGERRRRARDGRNVHPRLRPGLTGTVDRTGNLFGALSLVIADRMSDAVGSSDSAAVALSALLHFLDKPSVDLLRRVLGLTSSGTVRLLDRLEEAGHVERGPGSDGRSTSVSLTASGRRAARRVSAARAGVLDASLAVLSPAERRTLEDLMSKVLIGLIRKPGAVRWSCRLCDTHVCGRDAGECPVANAALARYPITNGDP